MEGSQLSFFKDLEFVKGIIGLSWKKKPLTSKQRQKIELAIKQPVNIHSVSVMSVQRLLKEVVDPALASALGYFSPALETDPPRWLSLRVVTHMELHIYFVSDY